LIHLIDEIALLWVACAVHAIDGRGVPQEVIEQRGAAMPVKHHFLV